MRSALPMIALLGLACAGDRAPEPMAPAPPFEFVLDSLPSELRTPTRAERFFRDPDSGSPEWTVLMKVTAGGRERFVLATYAAGSTPFIVVADTAGRIPEFPSSAAARQYARRHFPDSHLEDDLGDSANAEAERLGYMMIPHANLDLAQRWLDDNGLPGFGPAQAVLAWQLLAAAAEAPVRLSFDPMGMMYIGVKPGQDSTASAIMRAGMMVEGQVLDPRALKRFRPGGPPFSTDPIIWGLRDRAVLNAVLRKGIPGFLARLSPEAAEADASAGWPRPRAAQLVVNEPDLDREIRPLSPTEFYRANLEEYVRSRAGQYAYPAGTVAAAAMQRYRWDVEQYRRDLLTYLRVRRAVEDDDRRTVQFSVEVRNTGQMRSPSPLTVEFRLPSSVTAVRPGTRRRDPPPPAEPGTPAQYVDTAYHRPKYDPPVEYWQDQPAREEFERAADGSTLVRFQLDDRIGAGGVQRVGFVTVRFRDWNSVRSFDYGVRVLSGDSVAFAGTLTLRAQAER